MDHTGNHPPHAALAARHAHAVQARRAQHVQAGSSSSERQRGGSRRIDAAASCAAPRMLLHWQVVYAAWRRRRWSGPLCVDRSNGVGCREAVLRLQTCAQPRPHAHIHQHIIVVVCSSSAIMAPASNKFRHLHPGENTKHLRPRLPGKASGRPTPGSSDGPGTQGAAAAAGKGPVMPLASAPSLPQEQQARDQLAAEVSAHADKPGGANAAPPAPRGAFPPPAAEPGSRSHALHAAGM